MVTEFIVLIELRGCDFDGDEYARLEGLMKAEGFSARVHPLASRIRATNLVAHPSDRPHATYFGRSHDDRISLQRRFEDKINAEFQLEFSVAVL
jgi:hypothetical protein